MPTLDRIQTKAQAEDLAWMLESAAETLAVWHCHPFKGLFCLLLTSRGSKRAAQVICVLWKGDGLRISLQEKGHGGKFSSALNEHLH